MSEMKRLLDATIDQVQRSCPSTLDVPGPGELSDLVTAGDRLPVRVARVEIDDQVTLVIGTERDTGEPDAQVTVPLDEGIHDDLVAAALHPRDEAWAERITEAADDDLQGRVRGLSSTAVGVQVTPDDTVEDAREFRVTAYLGATPLAAAQLPLSGDDDADAHAAADLAAEALHVGERLACRWNDLRADDPDIEALGGTTEDGGTVIWFAAAGTDTDDEALSVGVFGDDTGARSVEWWQGDQWRGRLAERDYGGPREAILSLYFALASDAVQATGELLAGTEVYQGRAGDGLPQRVHAAIMAVPESVRESCTLVVDTETGTVSVHRPR